MELLHFHMDWFNYKYLLNLFYEPSYKNCWSAITQQILHPWISINEIQFNNILNLITYALKTQNNNGYLWMKMSNKLTSLKSNCAINEVLPMALKLHVATIKWRVYYQQT